MASKVDPDIVLAAQDALRESTAPLQPPGPRADAEQAGSQLRLWLQHAVDDFAAIDDLASDRPAGSVSPAHYSLEDRRRELRLWRTHGIRTMSFATLGWRPFSFRPGRPVRPFSLRDPATWPNHNLVKGAEATTDISYLSAYRACAGGPFSYPPTYQAKGYVDTELNTSLYEPDHLGPDGEWGAGERIEVWDNDGIVNTAGDGLMRLYNVWDSGRGLRPWESQSHTTGMIREVVAGGFRYHCSDINPDPSFRALVFTLTRN